MGQIVFLLCKPSSHRLTRHFLEAPLGLGSLLGVKVPNCDGVPESRTKGEPSSLYAQTNGSRSKTSIPGCKSAGFYSLLCNVRPISPNTTPKWHIATSRKFSTVNAITMNQLSDMDAFPQRQTSRMQRDDHKTAPSRFSPPRISGFMLIPQALHY